MSNNIKKRRKKAYLRVWILAGTLARLFVLAGMGFLSVSILTGTIWILAGMHAGVFAFAGMIFAPLDIFSLAGMFLGSVVFAGMFLCFVVFAGTHDGFL